MNPRYEYLYNYLIIDDDFIKEVKLINKDDYKDYIINYYENKLNSIDDNISKSVYLFCTESEDKYIKMSTSLFINSIIECYNILIFEIIELKDYDESNYNDYSNLIQDKMVISLSYLSKIYEDKKKFTKKNKIDEMLLHVKSGIYY